jgi:uncharacterized protein (DUF427 family)
MRRIVPGPGQESVWDYPRPPRVEPVHHLVTVEFGGEVIARSTAAIRVLETASPPTYYIPRRDVRMEHMTHSGRTSYCEWKGHAIYWSISVGERVSEDAAWSYPLPMSSYSALRDCLSFYASRVDRCRVGEHIVIPQAGDFYGGWITPEIVGPFKGEPGSEGW